MGRWSGIGGALGGIGCCLVLLCMARAARAQNIEYSEVDRATVRVLTFGAVGTYEVELSGKRLTLAAGAGAYGSGFAVTPDGLVVTAAHVVKNARALAVHVPGVAEALVASIVLIDEASDVAFLSVGHRFSSLAQLADADEKLEIRSELFAVGYPLDASRSDPQSARGVLSGRLPDGRLQLSINLNPGNSGGPVIDANGRVIGVVSARSDVGSGAVGLAAAVPLASFWSSLQRARGAPRTPLEGERARRLADLVSVLAHEGETLLRGTTQFDGSQATDAERRVEALLRALPDDADAALLGAAFFWNRHVALFVHGADSRRPRERALSLVHRVSALDPALAQASAFVRFLTTQPSKPSPHAADAGTLPRAVAHVEFVSDSPGIALHLKKMSRANDREKRGEAQAPWARICAAPCDQPLVFGTYQVALSRDDGAPVPVAHPLQLEGPLTLRGEYEDRSWLRSLGWVVGVGGPAVGVGVATYRIRECDRPENSNDGSCTERRPYLLPGLLLAAGSLAAGLVLVTRNDTAEVWVTPGVAGNFESPRPVGVEAEAVRGATLSGNF